MAKFQKGESGNRKGRRLGSRPKALALLDRMGEGSAADIMRAMIAKAAQGDTTAGALLLSRMWPPRRGRPMQLALPPIETADDVTKVLAAVTAAVANGELTTTEAAELATLVEAVRKSIELGELAADVKAIKEKLGPT